jgi:predicted ThiF/HesA family dinucleotide-utilizing enzyme
MPPGTQIEVLCDIIGLGLRLRGEVVWSEVAAGGVLHGVVVNGFASEQDALIHRLHVARLARHARERPP